MKYLIETVSRYAKDTPLNSKTEVKCENMAEAMKMVQIVNTVNRQYGSLIRVRLYRGGSR